jgi:hypothetical protein
MISVTRPQGLHLTDWADCICQDLDPYGSFGRLLEEKQWQSWAMQFFNNTTLGRNLPDPAPYTDWRMWAERFVQGLS